MQNGSTIFIKGMVCGRCILVVENELKSLGHSSFKVALGEATILDPHRVDAPALEKRLHSLGFRLLEDGKTKTVNAIKDLVAEVYRGDYDFPENFKFSALLQKRFGTGYTTLRSVFSESEKKSLEQYIIEYRIQKVKELLVYSSLTLSDIAFRLNFSSVPHLSTQFKQYTGLTPSHFKEVKSRKTDVIFSPN